MILRLWQTRPVQGVLQAFWFLAVFLLPITSMPILLNASQATTVAPPSAAVFLGLAILWGLPYLVGRGKFPVEWKPLGWWAVAVAISWGFSFFLESPPFRDRSIWGESLKAFTTLTMGLAAYGVCAGWLSAHPDQLKPTLWVINLSGLLLVVWSLLQEYYVLFRGSDYPGWMWTLQDWLSSRPTPLYRGRVTGFAFEPSWLAHQLNLVYLPLWLSATLRGFSAHRKVGRFSFENFLLIGGVIALYTSLSRAGWMGFLAIVAYLLLRANWLLVRAVLGRWKFAAVAQMMISLGALILLLGAYVLLGYGMLKVGARFDLRLERILERNPFTSQDVNEFTSRLAIAERFNYWRAGVNIWSEYPLFGVGVGNAGFYFPQHAPNFAYWLTEVRDVLYRNASMPNIKSLWVRLLAESGIVGFALFVSWFTLLFASARAAMHSPHPALCMIGAAGLYALIAFLVEGFSIDSFAIPYLWFSAGLLTAAHSAAQTALPGRES
jgi:hypothetical protein